MEPGRMFQGNFWLVIFLNQDRIHRIASIGCGFFYLFCLFHIPCVHPSKSRVIPNTLSLASSFLPLPTPFSTLCSLLQVLPFFESNSDSGEGGGGEGREGAISVVWPQGEVDLPLIFSYSQQECKWILSCSLIVWFDSPLVVKYVKLLEF